MAEAESKVVEPNASQLADVIDANPDQDAAAAAKAVADAAAATAAGGEEESGTVVWPDKWREEMAGDDAKKLTRLGRFDHPGRIFDSYLELEQAHKSADVRSPFPDEGSDKDKARWREDNSVPAEAKGYLEKLPDGLVVGEEDAAGMATLADAMHAVHAPAGVTHAAMGAYYEHVGNVAAERAEQDAAGKKATDDDLNELYGVDFRRNINDLNAWLGTAPEGVKENILSARTPDGSPLGNDPEYLKWMISQMRLLNPLVTVPGLGGGDPGATLDDEIKVIEEKIRTDNKTYRADKPMQARYLELIAARDRRK